MKVHGFKIKELLEVRKILELGAIRLLIENKIVIDANKLRDLNDIYYESFNKSQNLHIMIQLFMKRLLLLLKIKH